MPAEAKSKGQVRFSPYSFNSKTGELSRSGIRLRLERQPAKVLSMLIEADGDIVQRSELVAALWPGEIEGDFDRRLDKAIAKLRSSLNDDPAKPRYIETLKGRGYRFLGEATIEQTNPNRESSTTPLEVARSIESVDAVSEPEILRELPVPLVPAHGRLYRQFSSWWMAALGGIVLAVFLIALWLHGKSMSPVHSRPTVLVLGFQDVSNSSENIWVSHSVADWLSTDLGAGGDLQVVQGANNPELRTRAAEGGCAELPRKVLDTARRAFDADMVVYGDYSATDDGASGDRWRLNVCLDKTRDHKSPESMTVVGAKGDIAQLVFNAGEVLRSKLGLKQLSNQSLGYLRATLPSILAAARLYAEGTSALEHFEPEEASALLTQAEQFEPEHAATHAALSTAWAALGYQKKSQQEALIAMNLAKGLSPIQQLEYEGLADEAKSDWPAAVGIYTKLFLRYPDSVSYGLKLATAQINAAKAQLAVETVRTLRSKNETARSDPRVDLVEAAADSARSDYQGQLAASKQAEVHAEAQSVGLLVADARMEQGDANDMLGNWTDALRLWRLAGQSYDSIGDRGGMARALNRQANMAWKKGDAPTARAFFNESLSLSQAIGDNAGIAYCLSHLGIVRMAVDRAPDGGMPEAVKMYNQAAAIYHTIGNEAEEGYVYSLIGDEAMQRLQYEEARIFYLKAMALSQAANDKSRIAGRLLDLGIVDQVEGRNPEAIQFFRQSSQAYEELGQRDRAAIARIRLGISLFRSGKMDDAERTLQDSLATMRSFGRLNQVREALGDLARLELVQNPARAEVLAREQLKLDQQLVVGNVCCSANYALIAQTLFSQGRLQEAKEEIREAFARDQKSLAHEPLPDMLLARGDVRMTDRDYPGADADFDRALQMAQTRRARYVELQARLGLAELHFHQQGPSAKPELERVKHDAEQLGYGIFAIKIDAFLRSFHSAQ
ncbi:tetratricopeptide repeat protein [Acidicapsa acidisoli]|uniref:tetratricopeptide repeat protein n=1 Tax=Acidicapsa acidisoli TaxID=1615681 RepID=UPI0021DFD829|nr:tetratricopeptide repeat protein [Acidicapsa acidisoli]